MRLSRYLPHYHRNLQLATPVILSQVGQMLTGIADNLMVGRVSITALAACSFANSIFINVLVFSLGFSYGLTPLVGKAFGEKNYEQTAKLLRHGLLSNLLLSVVLFFILTNISFYLDKMGQAQAVATEAKPYFYLLSLSLIPASLFFTFKQFAEGIATTKATMVITICANILNIILNYIFIYGHLGFKPMGLVGAGWATLIARIYMGLALAAYILLQKKHHIWIKDTFKNQWNSKISKEIWHLGLPVSLQVLMEVIVFTVGAVMMGWINEKELAAHQIAISLASLSYMAANGLGAATTIRVSNLVGEKRPLRMQYAVFSSFHLVLAFMGTVAILFYLLKDILPLAFVNDMQVITRAALFISIAAIFQVSDGVQVVALGALRGLKDVKIPVLIILVSYWLIGFPIEYSLAFVWGMGGVGIWIGFVIGLSIAAILLTLRFLKINHLQE